MSYTQKPVVGSLLLVTFFAIMTLAQAGLVPDLGWSAENFIDGDLPQWTPTHNNTNNDGILWEGGEGIAESGISNFANITAWINSPSLALTGNPGDSWQNGLGGAVTQANVSWELIFRPGDYEGLHTLFNTGGNIVGTAFVLEGSVLDFRFQDADSADQRVIASTDLADIGEPSDFYHVVGVADVDSADTGTATLYVNGDLRGEPVTSAGTINDWDGGDLAELGTGNNIPGGNPFNPDPFTGDIALFNYYEGILLSEIEIENLFSNGLRPPGDSDGDGMPDDWEETYGLNPDDSADAALDADGDTLTNVEEFALGTNPNAKDTDEDGLDDNVETKTEIWVSASDTGTHPTRPDGDRDGLLDGVETNTGIFVDATDTGSNPFLKDTDGDGAADGLEVSGGFDPTDPKSVPSLQLKGGTFTIRHVDSSGGIDSRDATEAILSGEQEADQGDLTVQRAFVNFVDDVAAAFVDTAEAYPLWGPDGNGEGGPLKAASGGGGPNHDDFAIEVTGKFFIQAPGGIVTIGINSDDGFVLWIDGNEIGEAGNRARANSMMTVELAPGQHDLRMIQWERGGGAGGNMFIARGFGETAFNEGDFELLHAFDIAQAPLADDDSDGDNMADLWETFYFGDLSHGGSEDGDGDGLDDLGEYANKGNPTVKDTDGDGLEDGPEVHDYGTSPGLVDSDGDSLPDGTEVNTYKTDPAKADTDGDAFADNVELALGNDPLDAQNKPSAIIAVADGPWNDGATWSDGQAPGAGKTYVAVGTVTSKLISSLGTFGGDSLTLIGPGITLDLDHSGDASVNLVLNQANVSVNRNTSLAGKLDVQGDVLIAVNSNDLSLASQVTGGGSLTFQGGSATDPQGSVSLKGVGTNLSGALNVIGTDVAGLSPGSLGTGSILTAGGGVAFGYNYASPTAILKIQGGDFRIVLGGEINLADVVGVDVDGALLFSLFELAGPGPYTADDLLQAFQLDEGISGAGSLSLLGNEGDTDLDGLLDSWEQTHFGDLSATADGDDDGDGLTNLAEQSAGTDPTESDTDGDGLADGAELNLHGSDPTKTDTDGDGLDDAAEVAAGTNPSNVDTDGDQIPDNEDANPNQFDIGAGGTDLLVNGSFEDPELDNINTNNLGTVPTGWSQTGADATWNLIRNDGSDYGSGVDNAADGAQIIDLNGLFELYQNFVVPVDAKITFGASFANREAHDGSAPSALGIYDAAGANLLSDEVLVDTSADPTPSEEWRSGEASLDLPAGEYQIRVALNNFNNVDAVFVRASLDGGEGPGGDAPGTISDVVKASGAGSFSFGFPLGTTFDVQYSTDLENWIDISADVTGAFEDMDAVRNGASSGYYRGVAK